MSDKYYADDLVTIWHGDCLDVLRTLPDASVDAVVTDPPYGLEFMGKEWDSFGRGGSLSNATAGITGTGYTDAGDRLARPSFLGGLNPKCVACGKSQRGGSPCRCKSPEFTDERGPRLRAFQDWCELWARECLRVLKPGGHLVAFGGSRTWHRLAAAVEDAGFEIRDSIAWLYGSGFPKSHDVAKAITGAELGVGSNSHAIRRATMGDDYKPSGRHGNRDGAGRRDTGMADRALESSESARPWEGWGTALKPAFEPIVVARKPLGGMVERKCDPCNGTGASERDDDGYIDMDACPRCNGTGVEKVGVSATVAANVLAYGTGGLNINACRVGDGRESRERVGELSQERRYADAGAVNLAALPGSRGGSADGRWPANVVLEESQATVLDEQTGVLTSGILEAHHARSPKRTTGIYGDMAAAEGARGYGDSGGDGSYRSVSRGSFRHISA